MTADTTYLPIALWVAQGTGELIAVKYMQPASRGEDKAQHRIQRLRHGHFNLCFPCVLSWLLQCVYPMCFILATSMCVSNVFYLGSYSFWGLVLLAEPEATWFDNF